MVNKTVCNLLKTFVKGNKRQGKACLIDCYRCLHPFDFSCSHITVNSSYSPGFLNELWEPCLGKEVVDSP